MAHPLTQQPSSSLSFPFAARPSPLTFGFGLPSAAPSETPTHTLNAHSPHRMTGPACSSPSKNSFARPRPNQAFTPPTGSLKRTRRSRSPSTSPTGSIHSPRSRSPTPMSSRLGHIPPPKNMRTDLPYASKTVKRSKLHNSSSDERSAEGVDVGIMLGKSLYAYKMGCLLSDALFSCFTSICSSAYLASTAAIGPFTVLGSFGYNAQARIQVMPERDGEIICGDWETGWPCCKRIILSGCFGRIS